MFNDIAGLGFNRSHPIFSTGHRPEWEIHLNLWPWHRFKSPFITNENLATSYFSINPHLTLSSSYLCSFFCIVYMHDFSPLNCSSLRVEPYLFKNIYIDSILPHPPWLIPTLWFGPNEIRVIGEAITDVLYDIVLIYLFTLLTWWLPYLGT